MDKKRTFKNDTYLTDGHNIIKLGWRTSGKGACYAWSRIYPNKLYPKGYDTRVFVHSDYIPELWLQNGHHLERFNSIDKKLIHPEIIAQLELKIPAQ